MALLPNVGILLPIMGSHALRSGAFLPLFGKARQALLSLVFTRADEAHLQEDLIRQAALGRGAVQRELEVLSRAGVVRRTLRGRQVYFQANPDCPIYPELRGLIVKTAGVADALRVTLAPLAERIRAAFIYGSIARGTERRASDVDIMVIGDVSFAETAEALGRDINPSVYPLEEFRTKLAAKHHFLRNVLKGDTIFLIGDERELARLATQ